MLYYVHTKKKKKRIKTRYNKSSKKSFNPDCTSISLFGLYRTKVE